MKKALKWLGIIVGGLLTLLIIAAVSLSIAGASRLTTTYDVQPKTITLPTDQVALARGEYLVDVACRDCHGADLSGQILADEPPLFTIYASNITGAAERYTDEELLLAIRHGLRPDGRPLIIMPAEQLIGLSAEDTGAIIAYLNTIPFSGETYPEPEIYAVGRILAGIGAFDNAIPAGYIDHDQPYADMPPIEPSAEYGQYLSTFCHSCHGPDMAGGQPPDPDAPPAPDLTMNGEMRGWTEEEFITAMRTGIIPTGRQLNSDYMPYKAFANFDDTELRALWAYFQTLPSQEAASQ